MLSSSFVALEPSPSGCTRSKDFFGEFHPIALSACSVCRYQGISPLLFRTIVRIGILYRWLIQYTLPGMLKRNVPSPTIWHTNLPFPAPFSNSVASLIPREPPPDQPSPPPPQLIQEPGSVAWMLSATNPVFVTASIAQIVSFGNAFRSIWQRYPVPKEPSSLGV